MEGFHKFPHFVKCVDLVKHIRKYGNKEKLSFDTPYYSIIINICDSKSWEYLDLLWDKSIDPRQVAIHMSYYDNLSNDVRVWLEPNPYVDYISETDDRRYRNRKHYDFYKSYILSHGGYIRKNERKNITSLFGEKHQNGQNFRPRRGKGNTYVRWMGAFSGRHEDVLEQVQFELENTHRQVSCEAIGNFSNGYLGMFFGKRIGLLVAEQYICKTFAYDCYSDRGSSLRANRKDAHCTNHNECFVETRNELPFIGIVLTNTITIKEELELRKLAYEFGLEVISTSEWKKRLL